MTLSTRLWKLPKSTSKKQNIYNILLINMTQSCQIKQRYIHFTCILCLLNNTCVQHNFKSVHVHNLFWSREYNSAKEICKYTSFSKVGGNYPLDLKIIWSSGDIIIYPHIKWRWNRTMLYLCGIVVAILKMATGSNFLMSGINSGHHYLPTYQMLMISDNVEFLQYCGGHFENGDR